MRCKSICNCAICLRYLVVVIVLTLCRKRGLDPYKESDVFKGLDFLKRQDHTGLDQLGVEVTKKNILFRHIRSLTLKHLGYASRTDFAPKPVVFAKPKGFKRRDQDTTLSPVTSPR